MSSDAHAYIADKVEALHELVDMVVAGSGSSPAERLASRMELAKELKRGIQDVSIYAMSALTLLGPLVVSSADDSELDSEAGSAAEGAKSSSSSV